MEKGLEIILREMCRRVGADFEKINFKEKGWFKNYSWSIDSEKAFKEWLITSLLENKETRKALLGTTAKLTKRKAKDAAAFFVFNYGWRYLQTNENDEEYK